MPHTFKRLPIAGVLLGLTTPVQPLAFETVGVGAITPLNEWIRLISDCPPAK